MKTMRSFFKIAAIVLVVSGGVVSCKKDDVKKEYSYFVSSEKAFSLTTLYINSLIDNISGSFPDVDLLKPLVKSDVNVYKIKYKSTLDGKDIELSALVCAPAAAGSYPLLSFQNGTNTINSLAPSVYPLNNQYQLVELLASAGFVVVMADYPGFGESADVMHPYLIKDPTVTSVVDLLKATLEMSETELPDVTVLNDTYLLGYSQGGWATFALHKALELSNSMDFNLKGSACGAGPYDISFLLAEITGLETYNQPYYLGFILEAYSGYKQFTNPLSDIFREPYATRISTMYNGTMSSDQINSQLTTSIPDLLTSDFIANYATADKYSGVRAAFVANSVEPWHTYKPLMFLHANGDMDVNPLSTENMYNAMTGAGTSTDICKKVIVTAGSHHEGIVPCMLQGFLFLKGLEDAR